MMIETVGLGGAEMIVLQLTQELARRGHVVHPVVPSGRDGWLLDRFREAGIAWQTYHQEGPLEPRLPGHLARLFRELGVTVVHSHEFAMAVYGTLATRRVRIPHIITWHANWQMTTRLRRRMALRWAFRNSAAVVAVSADTKRQLLGSLGIRDESIVVIRNGVPIPSGAADRVRSEMGLDSRKVLLLGVGTLKKSKGFSLLLQALHNLHAHAMISPWRLVIAGEGEERPNLERQISTLGLSRHVRLLGNRTDVADLQAAADIFVMPSFWEGLPLAVLEAMFAGNGIVASNVSGIPEAISNGKEGLLIPPGDIQALAAALGPMINDGALRKRLGGAARKRALESFDIRTMADQYETLYFAASDGHDVQGTTFSG